jgi:hypothetical protein
MTTINISRGELYEKVWAAPLQKVADELDCDYWHLRSACSERHIPTPPKGYWMKVAHGKSLPSRPPLPDHPHGYKSVPLRLGLAAEKAVTAERRMLMQSIATTRPLDVPARLTDPHPAVAEIMSERASNPQLSAILTAAPNECVRRGFRIANAIARAVEGEGFNVAASSASEC